MNFYFTATFRQSPTDRAAMRLYTLQKPVDLSSLRFGDYESTKQHKIRLLLPPFTFTAKKEHPSNIVQIYHLLQCLTVDMKHYEYDSI